MKRKTMVFLGAMLLLPLMLTAAVCGDETTNVQDPGGNQVRGVTVAGEGKVTAEPDLALIQLGVSTLRPTVAEARQSAAESLTAMVDSLKANGVDEKDIQTTQLSISPEYDYRNNEQTLRGFRVTNTVNAKIRNIDTTGKAVDDAVGAGGDNATINGITFTIDDPTELQDQARRLAMEDAKRRAETLAGAGSIDLGDPINISESGGVQPYPYPVDDFARGDSAAGQAAPETPIQTGELDVVINITVTWGIN